MTLQNEIYDIIMQTDLDIRNKLFNNIIICGGNTLFDGFKNRLEKEINKLVLLKKVNVTRSCEPKYNAWYGGFVIGPILKDDPRCVITHDEYNDVGRRIVNSKFIL